MVQSTDGSDNFNLFGNQVFRCLEGNIKYTLLICMKNWKIDKTTIDRLYLKIFKKMYPRNFFFFSDFYFLTFEIMVQKYIFEKTAYHFKFKDILRSSSTFISYPGFCQFMRNHSL